MGWRSILYLLAVILCGVALMCIAMSINAPLLLLLVGSGFCFLLSGAYWGPHPNRP